MDKTTAYAVLGLESNASQQDIKNAYRELMQINHPDKQQNAEWKHRADEVCKRLTEAYGILSGKLEGASNARSGESFDPLWTDEAQEWWEKVKLEKWAKEQKIRAFKSNAKDVYNFTTVPKIIIHERYL